MAPPSFSDLSKDANDLYNKDFNFGSVKAELKTKAQLLDSEFKSSGSHDMETGRAAADVEVKRSFRDYGITLTNKWKTSNAITAEVAIEDRLAKGLKNSFEINFEPNTGKRSAKVKTGFKRANVNTALDLEFKTNFPTVLSSAVFGYQNFFAGASVGFDTERQKLTKLSYGAAFQVKDLSLYAGVENSSNYCASAYHRLSRGLEAGLKLCYSGSSHAADLGVAAKYRLNDGSAFKLRLNNRSLLGSSYSFQHQ
ncbi:hypothetical protein BOX15_Mlig031262g2 [Macrostomum lignano]|uniref:Voltage-dependent anion-selective channel protein 3 n=1 Tax=Macrostomum lignano TaxID=282301 RepID=A0A267G0Z4_9PLAT|nr:hypothetical protein BOX15_Mlig031262g2 [Macrostomum lignano]